MREGEVAHLCGGGLPLCWFAGVLMLVFDGVAAMFDVVSVDLWPDEWALAVRFEAWSWCSQGRPRLVWGSGNCVFSWPAKHSGQAPPTRSVRGLFGFCTPRSPHRSSADSWHTWGLGGMWTGLCGSNLLGVHVVSNARTKFVFPHNFKGPPACSVWAF